MKIDGGQHALHIAASSNAAAVIIVLLDKGADVNDQDKEGNTAVHLASYFGAKDALEVLLRKGADASVKNEEGSTAKDVACSCADAGDNPDAGCDGGKCSSNRDRKDIVKLLKVQQSMNTSDSSFLG